MGLVAVLIDEDGKRLDEAGDPENRLHRLLPSEKDSAYCLLRYIDWYADTTFNSLQVRDVLEEWSRLHSRSKSDADRRLLDEFARVIRKVVDQPHRYVRFEGD
jgi:hypothetical protein